MADTPEQHRMAIELDHRFVCTRVGAPEVDALVALGLTEGSANTHRGQGTTNRRISFRNAMLEFLWVMNEAGARSPVIAPTHLWERRHYPPTGYSPFGLGFRSLTAVPALSVPCPFDMWAVALISFLVSVHKLSQTWKCPWQLVTSQCVRDSLYEKVLIYLEFSRCSTRWS